MAEPGGGAAERVLAEAGDEPFEARVSRGSWLLNSAAAKG